MNAPIDKIQLQSTLRKMGNSTGLIVPKVILDQLGLESGAKVELRVENGELIAHPERRRIREGWEEDARRIGAGQPTQEEADWLEFDDRLDDDSPIPPEWLIADKS
ncbi:MAG: AbrB/MazE/SpoVT family DNA-binding domain-containing protein [Proteobacteria bacterium]|nr:AbrB/MazE/SpoVT family DNA-binding domain-containing protein [Pseudomonadota bacterium]